LEDLKLGEKNKMGCNNKILRKKPSTRAKWAAESILKGIKAKHPKRYLGKRFLKFFDKEEDRVIECISSLSKEDELLACAINTLPELEWMKKKIIEFKKQPQQLKLL